MNLPSFPRPCVEIQIETLWQFMKPNAIVGIPRRPWERSKRFIAYLDVYVLALVVGGKLLIMDNHPVHCAKAVKRFLEDHKVSFAFSCHPIRPSLIRLKTRFQKSSTIFVNASHER